MPIVGIAHVQVSITAGGEDHARFFYGSILGMGEVPKPDSLSDRGGVWFACGEQQLHCGVEDVGTSQGVTLRSSLTTSKGSGLHWPELRSRPLSTGGFPGTDASTRPTRLVTG
jgi:hypothetical protein